MARFHRFEDASSSFNLRALPPDHQPTQHHPHNDSQESDPSHFFDHANDMPKQSGHNARRNVYQYEQSMRWFRSTTDWDTFHREVYNYFDTKGVYCAVLAKCTSLLTLAFAIAFATFITGCIDHSRISPPSPAKTTTGKNDDTSVSSVIELRDVLKENCLATLHPFMKLTLFLFCLFWSYQLMHLLRSIPSLLRMNRFYTHVLGIPDEDIQTVRWSHIVRKLDQIHKDTFPKDNLPKRMNAYAVVHRIMRHQNYYIALFNKGLLDLRVPILGKQLLTKVMEWNLHFCLTNHVFARDPESGDYSIKPVFLRSGNRSRLEAELRRRFFIMGLLNLMLAPFTLVFVLLYFFFKYGEELHKNPAQFSARGYTPLAKWKFRDFNELPHLFQNRLNQSYPKAMRYLNQFPQQKLTIIAKFISYISGSIAIVLTLFSIIDEDILINFHVSHGRSVLWYIGLMTMIWSTSRSFIPDRSIVFDPVKSMRDVIDHTHFHPPQWSEYGLHSDHVRREFSSLFSYRLVNFAYELLAVVTAPFVLWSSLPLCAGRVVDFFREYSVHVDGVGWVCSLSVFENRVFNQERGLLRVTQIVESDKMDQSMVNFKMNFPDWEPNDMTESVRLRKMMESGIIQDRQHANINDDNVDVKKGFADITPAPSNAALPPSALPLNARVSDLATSQQPSQKSKSGYVPPSIPLDERQEEDEDLETPMSPLFAAPLLGQSEQRQFVVPDDDEPAFAVSDKQRK